MREIKVEVSSSFKYMIKISMSRTGSIKNNVNVNKGRIETIRDFII